MDDKKNPMTRRNLYIADHLWERAQEKSKTHDVSVSELVRVALQKYLAALEKVERPRAEA